jgi:hypothetical protein
MGSGSVGFYFLKGILFVVGAYVFSYIFWSTKMCLEKRCGKKKKK